MMLRTAGAGLTTPAVVGRGLSEGLGRTELTLDICFALQATGKQVCQDRVFLGSDHVAVGMQTYTALFCSGGAVACD